MTTKKETPATREARRVAKRRGKRTRIRTRIRTSGGSHWVVVPHRLSVWLLEQHAILACFLFLRSLSKACSYLHVEVTFRSGGLLN